MVYISSLLIVISYASYVVLMLRYIRLRNKIEKLTNPEPHEIYNLLKRERQRRAEKIAKENVDLEEQSMLRSRKCL